MQNWVEKSFAMSASISASAKHFIKSTAVHPAKTTFAECMDTDTDRVACQLFYKNIAAVPTFFEKESTSKLDGDI